MELLQLWERVRDLAIGHVEGALIDSQQSSLSVSSDIGIEVCETAMGAPTGRVQQQRTCRWRTTTAGGDSDVAR